MNWKQRMFAMAMTFCGAASAQTTIVQFTSDSGWICHPAVDSGGVIGFLAEQTAKPTSSTQVTVAWYERSGGDFKMTRGWQGDAPVNAAVEMASQYGNMELFANASIGGAVRQAVNTCSATPAVGIEMSSGLAIDDPFQPIAESLSAEEMETLVELGSAGASLQSAKEVDKVWVGEERTRASAEFGALTERAESDLKSLGGGMTLALSWFCWPGTYCASSQVTGPCRLVGGFGNNSCSGCKYSCTVTTITSCAYISLNCTVGPTTTTTATSTVNKSCPGDPNNCPSSPPPGC